MEKLSHFGRFPWIPVAFGYFKEKKDYDKILYFLFVKHFGTLITYPFTFVMLQLCPFGTVVTKMMGHFETALAWLYMQVQ